MSDDNLSKQEGQPGEELFLFGEVKIKDRKLSKSQNEWLENTFINYTDQEISSRNKNFLGLSLSQRKFFYLFLFFCFGLLFLFTRAAYLQVLEGGSYLAMAEQNRIRIHYSHAPRGVIYDRNKQPLVKNVPTFDLLITPFDLFQEEGVQLKVKEFLEKKLEVALIDDFLNLSTISKKDKRYFEPQLVLENLTYEQALMVLINNLELPGVSIDVASRRNYLTVDYNYNSLAHLLGYVGKLTSAEYDNLKKEGYLYNDSVGKNGLEAYYEKELRGEPGKKEVEVDSFGNQKKVLAEEKVVKGKSLVLSIDLEAQNYLEQLLKDSLKENNAERAAAIVLNPQNGEVLAMVSLPSYNNNLFAQGISAKDYQKLLEDENKPLFNRNIAGEYPSGSTVKMVMAAAGLEENIINQFDSFISNGGLRIGQWFFPDWRSGGHGVTDVYHALSDSVNTFFYIIGGGYNDFSGLGLEKIIKHFKLFGLSEKTGIDLIGENTGFLPSREWKKEVKNEPWYIGDTYHLSIGQGDLLVTPIQVVQYTSFFANGGTIYKPHLLKEIIDLEKDEQTVILPKIIKQDLIDSKNINIVRQGLRQAVLNGSARALNSLPVTSAAKTGTAQWGIDKETHAWFTAFAPYEESEIVITVLVEESGEGSSISAPIARDFLWWWFTRVGR